MAAAEPIAGLAAAALEIRANFQGRTAIYLEKGATYVRVRNIRYDHLGLIRADIEEIPATGLPVWIAHRDPSESHPLRWTIGTSQPNFSSDSWDGPIYVAWRVRFSPKLIAAILQMASHFPESYNPMLRYRLISGRVEGDAAEQLAALVSSRTKTKHS